MDVNFAVSMNDLKMENCMGTVSVKELLLFHTRNCIKMRRAQAPACI